MKFGRMLGWQVTVGTVMLGALAAMSLSSGVKAAPVAVPDEVTYTKDIAPILQRSCETCHRTNGAGPMSLMTYEEVRPWARSIKARRAWLISANESLSA